MKYLKTPYQQFLSQKKRKHTEKMFALYLKKTFPEQTVSEGFTQLYWQMEYLLVSHANCTENLVESIKILSLRISKLEEKS